MRIEQAIREKLSYQEFLEILINDELMNRTNNGNQRRMQQAKFPQIKTMEEFNFNYQPSINRQTIYHLGACEFIRKKENIAFIGPPGTGKTHLAISIGAKAVVQGYSVIFITLNDMLEDLYMSRADNSFAQRLKKYTQCDLLIIDELGLKKLNQTSVDDFYEVIARDTSSDPPSLHPTKLLKNGAEYSSILFWQQPSLIGLSTTATSSS